MSVSFRLTWNTVLDITAKHAEDTETTPNWGMLKQIAAELNISDDMPIVDEADKSFSRTSESIDSFKSKKDRFRSHIIEVLIKNKDLLIQREGFFATRQIKEWANITSQEVNNYVTPFLKLLCQKEICEKSGIGPSTIWQIKDFDALEKLVDNA